MSLCGPSLFMSTFDLQVVQNPKNHSEGVCHDLETNQGKGPCESCRANEEMESTWGHGRGSSGEEGEVISGQMGGAGSGIKGRSEGICGQEDRKEQGMGQQREKLFCDEIHSSNLNVASG